MTTHLSPRQETFCRFFVVTGNAAESARRAGYSEGSDRQICYENLTKPYILINLLNTKELVQ